jgi:hypothetical protein
MALASASFARLFLDHDRRDLLHVGRCEVDAAIELGLLSAQLIERLARDRRQRLRLDSFNLGGLRDDERVFVSEFGLERTKVGLGFRELADGRGQIWGLLQHAWDTEQLLRCDANIGSGPEERLDSLAITASTFRENFQVEEVARARVGRVQTIRENREPLRPRERVFDFYDLELALEVVEAGL